MMDRDKIIKLDDDTRKRIGKLIGKEIESSIGDNKRIYDLIQRCNNQYNQVTRSMQEGKEVSIPFKGAADYFVPITEWIIDSIHSRLMHQLFSQEPFMTASGIEGKDVDNEANVTEFVNMVFSEIIHLRKSAEQFFKKMIMLPIAVMKYDWVRETEQMFVDGEVDVFVNKEGQEEYVIADDEEYQQKALQLISNGYASVSDKRVKTMLQDVDFYNAMKIEDINPMDYVWAANTKKGQKPYWEGVREWKTWDYIKSKGKDGVFYSDSVMEVKKIVERLIGEKKSTSDGDFVIRNTQFECFDWYGRLPFNMNKEIDFSDNIETIEMEVHAFVMYGTDKKSNVQTQRGTNSDDTQNKNDEECQLLYLAMWESKRLPVNDRVFIREGFEDTEGFTYRSLTEKLYKTQQLTNTIYNTLLNNAYLAMMKIFKKKRSLYGEDVEDDIEIYPGAVIDVEEMDDLQVLEIGDLKNIGLEIEKDVMGMAERLSNISDWNTGNPKDVGKATATEFAGIMRESRIGTDKTIQRAVEVLKKICQWTVAGYEENMPEGLERRITGKDNERIFPSDETAGLYQERGIEPYWTPGQITGAFDFTWNNTSLNSNQQYNIMVANDLQERYLPNPMISSNLLAVWQILKDGLVARGKQNWQAYLPPKEAVVAEMERKKAEDEARQNAQRLKKRFPEIVAQKLVQRGVNPAKAQVMAAQIVAQNGEAQQTLQGASLPIQPAPTQVEPGVTVGS